MFTFIFQFDNLTGSPEHFVHIEGVVGSSPTVTTQKSGRRYESTLAGFFCVPFCVPLRVRTRGTQRVRKNRCVPVRKWGTQMPKKCVPSTGYSFTSTVPGQSSFEFGQKSAYAPPPIKSARFLDRAASRGYRGNVERNTGKRFYSASKVMLTLALTISFADWTTVPKSSSTSAGSSIPVVREYTFPTLFW